MKITAANKPDMPEAYPINVKQNIKRQGHAHRIVILHAKMVIYKGEQLLYKK